MPGFDGTGPAGMGPRTGGGRGFCSPGGSGYSPYIRGAGRGATPWGGGRGRTWGGGRSFRGSGANRFAEPAYWRHSEFTPAAEAKMLENQATALEDQLQMIRSRLDELRRDE